MPRGYRMGLLLLGDSPSVPDGSTVTPINDVPTWLQCAGIPTTTYTTLAEVLADASLLRVLINSENAMDYLVRCKEWIGIGLVPAMTSNTTPSGVASASSVQQSDQSAYNAFDKIETTEWHSVVSSSVFPVWISYEFDSSVGVKSIKMRNRTNSNANYIHAPKDFKIQTSNDGSIWSDVGSFQNLNNISGNESKYELSTTEYSKYWRMYITTTVDGQGSGVNIGELQFYSLSITDSQSAMQLIGTNDYASNTLLADSDWCEAIGNSEYSSYVLTTVPIMTSNNTPSGLCFSNKSASSGYDYYKAFDNNDSTFFFASSLPAVSSNLGYKFDNDIKIYKLYYKDNNSASFIKFQVSNDNETYTTVVDNISVLNGTVSTIITNAISAKYNRIVIDTVKSTSNNWGVYTLQFYGRPTHSGVQSWLLSAGITNKSYTTLSQVLSDTDTLTALISSHSAMDYLVTCTSWANDICSNQTAMTLIGNDNYASNKLLADSTWLNAICNSTYFESVLNVKVPIMTSNTTPSGECSASGYMSGYEPYRAYDGDVSTWWGVYEIGENVKVWSQYAFDNTRKAYNIRGRCMHSSTDSGVPNIVITIKGSNDNSNFENIYSETLATSSGKASFNAIISNPSNWRYYRFEIYHPYRGTGFRPNMYENEIQVYGREDV